MTRMNSLMKRTKILHRIVANTWIYDHAQLLVGARQVHNHIAAQIAYLCSATVVLDLGGGTGTLRRLWPATRAYICLDIDLQKLRRFKRKYPDGIALLSDATHSPIRSGSVDVVLCMVVAHHVPDSLLIPLIGESGRVLKRTGRFIFMDAIWNPQRWIGRLLWKYDRGSYPRTGEVLLSTLSHHYTITRSERFSVFHEYILCIGTRCLAQPSLSTHSDGVGYSSAFMKD